jgi:hypothetical protein
MNIDPKAAAFLAGMFIFSALVSAAFSNISFFVIFGGTSAWAFYYLNKY